jgi:hypothetical protein
VLGVVSIVGVLSVRSVDGVVRPAVAVLSASGPLRAIIALVVMVIRAVVVLVMAAVMIIMAVVFPRDGCHGSAGGDRIE